MPNDEVKTEFDIYELQFWIGGLDDNEKDNLIISQDTGHKDKNGEHIYTGDILRIKTHVEPTFNEPVVVEYRQEQIWIHNVDETHGEWLGRYTENEVEIIGNVWQNSELLEGGDE